MRKVVTAILVFARSTATACKNCSWPALLKNCLITILFDVFVRINYSSKAKIGIRLLTRVMDKKFVKLSSALKNHLIFETPHRYRAFSLLQLNQILGIKTVINVQIDPQTTKNKKLKVTWMSEWHLSTYREAELLKNENEYKQNTSFQTMMSCMWLKNWLRIVFYILLYKDTNSQSYLNVVGYSSLVRLG